MRLRSRTIPRLLVSGSLILVVAFLAHRILTTRRLDEEFERARLEEKEGRYQNALELLKEAVKSGPGNVDYSHRYSVALYQASRLEEAETIAKGNYPKLVELALVDPEAHLPSLIENRTLIGDIGKSRGNLKDAENAYEEAYKLYQELPGSERHKIFLQFVSLAESLAGIYRLNAEAEENRGASDGAKQYWNEASQLYGEARDVYWKFPASERQERHLQFVRLSELLAELHEARAEARQAAGAPTEAQECWAEAEKSYEEGRDIYRKLSPSERQERYGLFASLSRGLAKAHGAMGRTERAEEVLIEARDELWKLFKQDQSRFSPILAAVLTDLARFALAQKQIRLAEEYSNNSVTVCRRLSRTEPKLSAATLLASLPVSAAVQSAQGRWSQAQEIYDEARRLYWGLPAGDREIHRYQMISILESLSTLQSGLGNRKAQAESLQEASDLGWELVRNGQQKDRAIMVRILDQMAALARDRKDPVLAQQYSTDAAWIYRTLYHSNREAYGDRLALALLGMTGKNLSDTCELLDEASGTARTPDVQDRISQARAKASCH